MKFYQNELTNLEARYAAVRVALLIGMPDVLAGTIANLSATERGLVLKGGESTIELELQRAENDTLRGGLKLLGSALPKRR